MTPEQKTAIAAKLGADLATISSDRLIELALLHRAAPTAQPDFPNRLQAEIARRFTADAIAQDDVTYSTLQHLADELTGVVPLAHRLLHEMAASVNRDIWFTDNAAAFKDVLNNADTAKWLAGQTDVLEKSLNNRLALTMIADSETAATAILSQADAVTLWKNAPGLWEIWPKAAAGMNVLAKSGELVQYLIDTAGALPAAMASATAVKALVASTTAMRVIAASQTAVDTFLASTDALNAIDASPAAIAILGGSAIAMGQIAASAVVLKRIYNHAEWRKALIENNAVFQAVRETIYKTVSASGSGWVKRNNASLYGASIPSFNTYFGSVVGFLFARFSRYSSPSGSPPADSKTTMNHPGGTLAAEGQDNTILNRATLDKVDGISFNGATFKNSDAFNWCYVEIWNPA
jgi:hypothetical protein|nr:MAG TPA: Tail fiber protein [Caudoviricetes sp.]